MSVSAAVPPTMAKDNIALVKLIRTVDNRAQIPTMSTEMKADNATKHIVLINTTYRGLKILSIFRAAYVDKDNTNQYNGENDAAIGNVERNRTHFRGLTNVLSALGKESFYGSAWVDARLPAALCSYYIDYNKTTDQEFARNLQMILSNHHNTRKYGITEVEMVQLLANLGLAAKHEDPKISLKESIDTLVRTKQAEYQENVKNGRAAAANINLTELSKLLKRRRRLLDMTADLDSIVNIPNVNTIIPYSDKALSGGLYQDILSLDFIRGELEEFDLHNSSSVLDTMFTHANDYMINMINYFKARRNNVEPPGGPDTHFDQLYNQQCTPRTIPSNQIRLVDWKPSEKSKYVLLPRTGIIYPPSTSAALASGNDNATLSTAALGWRPQGN